MLQIENLTIGFGGKVIIDKLQLSLTPKQCVGLLGANGAGKSTLLKALSQEIEYQGNIHWFDTCLANYSIAKLSRTIGFLSQYTYLDFAFTAEEVVMLGRMMHSTSHQENIVIIQEIMNLFDITHLAKNSYPLLSGGEKQRVHAARVWAQQYEEKSGKAKILLLDEPTSALDLKHQHALLEETKRYAEQGNLVVLTVHDLNLAARYCDHLILLHEGKVIAQGKAENVLTSKNIQTVYGYSAKIMSKDGHLMIW